jgi:hypothetical protein
VFWVWTIQANDWPLVAITAILLTCKTENSPRSTQNVIHVAAKVDPLSALDGFAEMFHNKPKYDRLCELVFKRSACNSDRFNSLVRALLHIIHKPVNIARSSP